MYLNETSMILLGLPITIGSVLAFELSSCRVGTRAHNM